MDHITITDNGQKLLTRIAAGETTAVFTRIGTTDDQYTDDELQHLSALKNICQQADIVNVDVKDDTTIVISGYVDNKELEKGYYVAAVGIFAKAQGEEEILYGVSQVSNRPFLPGYSETLTGISIRFTLKVGNSSNIMVNVDETTSVTTGEFHAYRRNFDEALLRIEYPGFEDYSSEETELPDLEDAVSQIVSGKRITVLFQYIKASLKGLTSLAQRALSVAMGKNQARVFATVEALDAWLAVPANAAQLNVGDNFYITAVDVPDYWWDGTQKQKLETQKVDLTTYDQRISANANAISELNGKYNSFEQAKSTIINSALGKALSMTFTSTLDTIASKIASVVNRGTWNGSITTSGGSVTIPAGYHDGSGKVTGPALVNLVGTNVTLESAGNLLSGVTAYGKNGTKYTGSMTNRGATSGSITASGGSYTIPDGYHNGNGKVTGPTLASLVGSNVNLDNNAGMLSGYTAYGKNGTKYTGSIATKGDGSTKITASGRYGYDRTNGFWMYIPANAYYTTAHWLSVPVSNVLTDIVKGDKWAYIDKSFGVVNSGSISVTPPSGCTISVLFIITGDTNSNISISISGNTLVKDHGCYTPSGSAKTLAQVRRGTSAMTIKATFNNDAIHNLRIMGYVIYI